MMRTNHAFRSLLILLLLLGGNGQSAAADESVWVRVHHPAGESGLRSLVDDQALADYGRFQWGRISAADLVRLRDAGFRVSVAEDPFRLNLGGKSLDLLELDSGRSLTSHGNGPAAGWHIVQFDGPVRPGWLDQLRARGLQVAQPIHPFGYYVWADAEQISAVRSLPRLRASAPVHPEWKVQPHLRHFGPEKRPTMAMISRHVLRRTLAAMDLAGAEILDHSPLSRHFELVYLEVAGDHYLDLAGIPGVYTVQYIVPELGPRGEMSNQTIVRSIDGSGTVLTGYAGWLDAAGYDGSGVVVGVVDAGIDENHVDLSGRMSPCLGTEGSCTGAAGDHGTHVAGAIAGTAASGITNSAGFLRGQGVAPGAAMVNQDYRPFTDLSGDGMVSQGMLRIFRDSAISGALLTNNSWGPSGSPQGYDIPTMQVDYITRDALPDQPGQAPILAVWSIMNGWGDSNGACGPSSLGAPDEAKNLLAVGSTNMQTVVGAQVVDIFSISSNSAHGPACDGRNVPDIVAPGWRTDSTFPGNDFGLMGGTSMASPVVSGAIALWADRYIEEHGINPSPALMKAVFIAAAENLEGGTDADGRLLGHRPDRFQGYGLIDLNEVMDPIGGRVYLLDQEVVFTEAGQAWSEFFSAADPNEPVRITLTWTDAPGHGQGGTAPAWVNLLDLEVETASADTYLGNVIGTDGWSATGGQADDRNNTESVYLRPDQHQGGIEISVIASLINGDALDPHDPGDPSQDFALACYNCLLGHPTFELEIQPPATGVCIPDSGSDFTGVDIQVSALGAYSEIVELTSSTLPGGVTSDLDPESVVAPGDAFWTLTVDETATAGSFSITLSGDDGEELRQVELGLLLEQPVTTAPQLLAPADAIAHITTTPMFEWQAITEVGDYRIQIAEDADFFQLVVDEIIEGTVFSPDPELETGTEYFWRVQGINLCDGGPWSDIRSLTTRLEPVAEFSTSRFHFDLLGGLSDEQILTISNTGTGNLTFDVSSDEVNLSTASRIFTDYFDFANWAMVNSPSDVAGSVDIHDSEPAEVFVTGGDSDTAGLTDFQIEIPVDGIIHFDWGYQSEDSDCWDSGGFVVNGKYSILACNSQPVEYFVESRSIEVKAGDLFGFRVVTEDGEFGPGELGITQFEFEADACRTPVSPPWLAAWPVEGVIDANESEEVVVAVDSQALDDGDYLGVLCVETNDPNQSLVKVEVLLSVKLDELAFSFSDLVQPYSGAPLSPTINTDPPGIEFTISYDGQPNAPIEIGDYLVEVVAEQPGYFGSDSATFTIREAGQALRIADQPSGRNFVGMPLNPVLVVEVLGADEQVLTSDNETEIEVFMLYDSGPGQLSGTRSRTVDAGIAIFDDLQLDASGESYRLLLVDSEDELDVVLTDPFEVLDPDIFQDAFDGSVGD